METKKRTGKRTLSIALAAVMSLCVLGSGSVLINRNFSVAAETSVAIEMNEEVFEEVSYADFTGKLGAAPYKTAGGIYYYELRLDHLEAVDIIKLDEDGDTESVEDVASAVTVLSPYELTQYAGRDVVVSGYYGWDLSYVAPYGGSYTPEQVRNGFQFFEYDIDFPEPEDDEEDEDSAEDNNNAASDSTAAASSDAPAAAPAAVSSDVSASANDSSDENNGGNTNNSGNDAASGSGTGFFDEEVSDVVDNIDLLGDQKGADIVFIVDVSGSMTSSIDRVERNLEKFLDFLKGLSIDVNVSVIEYNSYPSETVYHTFNGSHWTSDKEAARAVIKQLRASGGAQEIPMDAFKQIEWQNNDHHKYVFLLTDESYANSGTDDMKNWVNTFRSQDVKVTVVGDLRYRDFDYRSGGGGNPGGFHSLYSSTYGQYINIYGEWDLSESFGDWIYGDINDTDEDGIPDDWETGGVDYNHDGVKDFYLPGASVGNKDVYIELDWMPGMAPTQQELKIVADQYAKHGITLHIDAGENSVNFDGTRNGGQVTGADQYVTNGVFKLGSSYENWNDVAEKNFDRSRWTTFRYSLWVDRFDCNTPDSSGRTDDYSGIADNLGGQCFIVSKGGIHAAATSDPVKISNETNALAGTFMHELGHTLGLSHDHDYTPNHISIMNYMYQYSGLVYKDGTRVVDYQEFDLPEIDETKVNEYDGIDPDNNAANSGWGNLLAKYKNFTSNKGAYVTNVRANGREKPYMFKELDFNQDGTVDSVPYVFDLNGDGTKGVLPATYNEWDQLVLRGGLIGRGFGVALDLSSKTLVEAPYSTIGIQEVSIGDAYKEGALAEDIFPVSDAPEEVKEEPKSNVIDDEAAMIFPFGVTRSDTYSYVDLVLSASLSKDSATLSWNKVPGAASYTVYLNKDGEYVEIKSLKDTHVVVKGLKNGKKYDFMVKYTLNGSESPDANSGKASVTPRFKPVVKASVSNGKVKLKWNSVQGAEKYAVYKYVNGRLSKLAETDKLGVFVGNVSVGGTYSYVVKAYVDGNWTKAVKSDVVTVTV